MVLICRNISFIMLPINGERTPVEKFIVPVRNAKTVPSMCLGVILANKTIAGKSVNAIARASWKNVNIITNKTSLKYRALWISRTNKRPRIAPVIVIKLD